MTDIPKELVVTSINPFSNLDYQVKCFETWKRVGFQALTCNTEDEAKLLTGSGFEKGDILPVRSEDSGQELFGKHVPRIQPLLQDLEREQGYDFFLLTNSDIYPATRSSSIVRYWSEVAPALALTRDETHDLSAHAFDSTAPYRGGLDTFFFTRSSLHKVNDLLTSTTAAPRMSFGIPGWDYLLGACLLMPNVGGKIVDSQVLLHQSHRPTYGNMEEFAHYVQDLQRIGLVKAEVPAQAAEEFAYVIESSCKKYQKTMRTAKSIYYQPPARSGLPLEISLEFDQTWQTLIAHAPFLDDCYRKRSLVSLFQRLKNDSSASLDTVLSLILNSSSTHFQFSQVLFGILFSMYAKYDQRQPNVQREYPKGNQHATRAEKYSWPSRRKRSAKTGLDC